MKNAVIVLLIILLSSVFLGAVNLSYAVPQTGSLTTSYDELAATYTESGNLTVFDVDYWWISGVDQGEQVLVNIVTDPNDAWESRIYYSNLTLVQSVGYGNTHIHEFIASKTDTYLLRITNDVSFNYTIESTHPIDAGQLPPTELSFVLLPNPATVGGLVVLQGTLTSYGNPVPSAKVTIKLGANPVGTLTTNSTGWFKASGSVGSAGTYNITVQYAGSEQYLPSANWTILVVKEATKIYCRIDPNPVNVSGSFTYEGILVNGYSQPLAGATIQLYKRTLTGPWVYIASVATNTYGIFNWQSTATTTGTFVFAAYYAGSETREPNYNYAVQVVQ